MRRLLVLLLLLAATSAAADVSYYIRTGSVLATTPGNAATNTSIGFSTLNGIGDIGDIGSWGATSTIPVGNTITGMTCNLRGRNSVLNLGTAIGARLVIAGVTVCDTGSGGQMTTTEASYVVSGSAHYAVQQAGIGLTIWVYFEVVATPKNGSAYFYYNGASGGSGDSWCTINYSAPAVDARRVQIFLGN